MVLISLNNFSLDVRELSQRCVGGQELQQQYQKIQGLGEETSAQLKRNVYQNYTQFIETAKEISRILSLSYTIYAYGYGLL